MPIENFFLIFCGAYGFGSFSLFQLIVHLQRRGLYGGFVIHFAWISRHWNDPLKYIYINAGERSSLYGHYCFTNPLREEVRRELGLKGLIKIPKLRTLVIISENSGCNTISIDTKRVNNLVQHFVCFRMIV